MRNQNHHQHFQKRIAIFGAGQAGQMASTWLPADAEVVGFIDNDPSMQGKLIAGMLVLSLDFALQQDLDLIVIAVLNRDAEAAIRRQIREAGYDGEIRSVSDIRGMIDIRLSALRLAAAEIKSNNVPGAAAELGVFRGEFAAQINQVLPDRKLYLFDTFTGFDERDLALEEGDAGHHRDFSDTSEAQVLENLPFPDQAVVVKGYFPESLGQLEEQDTLKFALVSLDPDLFAPTLAGLEYFYPRLSPGGMILVHDYTSAQFPGVREAVRRFADAHGIVAVPLMDLHGTAVIAKGRDA